MTSYLAKFSSEGSTRPRPRRRNSVRKLLLLEAFFVWCVVQASAQNTWPGGANLPDALPPTHLVSAPTISAPGSRIPQADQTVRPRSSPGSGPSIVWHLVDGRWHWHCV